MEVTNRKVAASEATLTPSLNQNPEKMSRTRLFRCRVSSTDVVTSRLFDSRGHHQPTHTNIQKFKLLSKMSDTSESDTDTDGDDFLEERPGKRMKAAIPAVFVAFAAIEFIQTMEAASAPSPKRLDKHPFSWDEHLA